MLRMIIVDDEKIIRETIRDLIDWKSLGIEIVGICKNGLEAYDAIIDEYPDIVLTDIRMPGLSGLELIKKLTQTHEKINFIILSGHSEFEYAREAMRYGIKYYLLKPCNEQQIIEVVKEVSSECLKYHKDQTDSMFTEQGKNIQSLPHKPFIEKMLVYIEEHLNDSTLSLKWIADNYLYMNVDYVSKQFYKQTGEKFSAYLSRLRIERAKKLLLDHKHQTIHYIAEQVGCGNNPQYFSQLFKKYTGLTPTDYIKIQESEQNQ